jgi:hypothetical protein
VGETPVKRNLNDISEVEFNFMGFRSVRESIERFLRCRFDPFDNTNDFVNRRHIDYIARSIDEESNVFVKLNVRRECHALLLLLPAGVWGPK